MAALPTPGGSDVWGANLNAAIESVTTQGLAASLPASGDFEGQVYAATDTGQVWRWDGTAWAIWALALPEGTADGDVPVWDDTAGLWVPGTGGGAGETYDDIMAELGSSVVHRWAFDETSGATCADSQNGLTITLAGTYTRNVTSPLGKAVTFASGGYGATSGLGSIPVGNNPRTVVAVYQKPGTANGALYGWGSAATRQWFSPYLNNAGNPIAASVYSDDIAVSSPIAVNGSAWHFSAFSYDGANRGLYYLSDTTWFGRILAGDLATASSGNFVVGRSPAGDSMVGSLADLAIVNTALSRQTLDRLFRAIPG